MFFRHGYWWELLEDVDAETIIPEASTDDLLYCYWAEVPQSLIGQMIILLADQYREIDRAKAEQIGYFKLTLEERDQK